MKQLNPNWYRYRYSNLDKWNIQNLLKTPKPRKTRKLAAIAKCIEKSRGDNPRIEKWLGAQCGNYWIRETDGHRALLVRNGNPDAEKVPFRLSCGDHSVTISDPEFYLALKRVLILANSNSKRITFHIEGKVLTLSASCDAGHSEVDIEVENYGNHTGEFSIDGKSLLECLGSWPVTVSWNSSDVAIPALFEFSEFACVVAQLKVS